MKVTGVEPVSRSRYKVYVDDRFAFVLYKGELHLYAIREGEELEEKAYAKIMGELLPKRAKLRCMNLLKSRPYTEKRLREKLEEGLYPAACVKEALDYVKSFGYVDDVRYAGDYIEEQKDRKSRRMIEQDLKNRGVASEIIKDALASVDQNGEGVDEEALARRLLEKKHFSPEEADWKEIQKMAAFLYRKGIGADAVRKVLQNEGISFAE